MKPSQKERAMFKTLTLSHPG